MIKINKFECRLPKIEPIIVLKTDNRIRGYRLTSLVAAIAALPGWISTDH